MKKFNTGVARIKNSEGKYEMLPALRGATSYEVAVRNGFKGTEDDWLSMMIDDGWVGKYQELDDKKSDKDSVYTKEEVNNISSEMISSLGPIASYLTFVGNVNADMVAAAFGKGNEDSVLGVGKALAMYANFKGETEKTDYLAGYDTYHDVVKNHKVDLIKNSTIYSLISSSPYALDVLKKTNAGLPDIVLYNAGETEYLNIANATAVQNSSKDGDGNIFTETNYYSLDTSKGCIQISETVCNNDSYTCMFYYDIPLLKDLPDLTGYRYLHVKFADSPESYIGNKRNPLNTLDNVSMRINVANKEVNVVSVNADGVNPNTVYTTGNTYSHDLFNHFDDNPASSLVKILIYAQQREAGSYEIASLAIEKIWISEN